MKIEEILNNFVKGYVEAVTNGFEDRWSKVKPGIYNKGIHECIGALLSRQATLTIEMAQSPSIWNGHSAPLFLRCMVDAYINLAWILDDPEKRSELYILYGLGQEKLFIENLEQSLQEDPEGSDAETIQRMIDTRRSWLNGQLAEWATEVNIGSWSGISTREMAIQIGRESIYKHAYVPFSGPVHNMWQHVGVYNVQPCQNPLHKWHLTPKLRHSPVHPDYMYRSAKYMTITFEIFDEKMGIKSETILPLDFLVEHQLFSGEESC